jgi:hypothetical protein
VIELAAMAMVVLCVCLAEMGSSRPGRQVPDGRMDVLHSMEVVTPHVKWADPYSRGPLRAWLMPNVIGGRDVVELAQRLGLIYDTLTLDSGGYNAWGFGDFYGKRGGPHDAPYTIDYQYLVEDLESDQAYDVLVIPGTHPWHDLPEVARAAIARRVREGAGLVLIAPRCDPERLAELAELSPLLPQRAEERPVTEDSWKEPRPISGDAWKATQPHYITSGVPLVALPFDHMSHLGCTAAGEVLVKAGCAPVIAVRSYGKGRVVALGYENSCFSPQIADPWRCELAYPYWEYYYSLLCRALVWAADREPEARLSAMSAADGVVRVSLQGSPQPVTVTATFRDERYHAQRVIEVKGQAGAEMQVAIPSDLNGGRQFADVIVHGEAGVLDWGTVMFEAPRGVSIASLTAGPEVVPAGDTVSGVVGLSAASPAKVSVSIWFEDNYGRVLDRARHEITVEQTTSLPYQLTTAHCLTRLGRVVCQVNEGDRIPDRKSAPLFVLIPQVWDDYEIIMDRFLPEPAPGRWPEIAKSLDRMNVSVMGAISPEMSEHVNFKIQADVVCYGFHPRYYRERWNASREGYIATRDKQWLVREPCFYDPEHRNRFRDDLASKVRRFARFSPVSYYAYEEPSLTYFGGMLDVCWCPSCLEGFREWLRKAYRSLKALNQEWGSSYRSWDAVMPLTTEEAQGAGRYAPWADYRTWMEAMWADTYREGREIIRGLDPNAVVCLSGNQEGNPFNGYDYSRLNHHVDQMQQYTGENLDEFNRSFYPGMRCTGCTGYGVSDPDLSLQLWGRLLNGDTAGCVIFWEISCLNPDLTFCKSGADLAKHFGELRGDGVARLLSNAERDNCGIAIHYSYPSMHGTWITDGEIIDKEWSNRSSRALELFNRDRIAWTNLLEGLGYQYDFVAYSHIEKGDLLKRGYRLLILPHSVAISEKEAARIEEFVAAGGVVIADMWPGVMNEHCTWRRGGRLDALFGIAHESLQPSDFQRTEAGERVRIAGAESGWCAGHPGVARKRMGEGKAIYLGRSVAPLLLGRGLGDRERLASYVSLVQRLMEEARMAPPASVVDSLANPALTCESVRYRAGSAEYFGIVRYPAVPEEKVSIGDETGIPPLEDARASLGQAGDEVSIAFPDTRHTYDVRQRRYLGHTDRVAARLGYGGAAIYARLPYTVSSVEISAPKTVRAGKAVSFAVKLGVSGEAGVGDHVAAVRVYGPDGVERRHYGFRLALPKGRGKGAVPLALSDDSGKWRIAARDVATGAEGEVEVAVTG